MANQQQGNQGNRKEQGGRDQQQKSSTSTDRSSTQTSTPDKREVGNSTSRNGNRMNE